MVRTQVQFTEAQIRRIRNIARREGTSVAELIRRSVERLCAADVPDREQLFAKAATVVGAFEDRGKAKDLAARHDDYLDETFR
jgi:Spy/CpxP family protein refolding chaperone